MGVALLPQILKQCCRKVQEFGVLSGFCFCGPKPTCLHQLAHVWDWPIPLDSPSKGAINRHPQWPKFWNANKKYPQLTVGIVFCNITPTQQGYWYPGHVWSSLQSLAIPCPPEVQCSPSALQGSRLVKTTKWWTQKNTPSLTYHKFCKNNNPQFFVEGIPSNSNKHSPKNYPLVNQQFAILHGHRNTWFTHLKWVILHRQVNVYLRV